MIAKQVLSCKIYQVTEGYVFYDTFFNDGKQQIGNLRTPYLYFDGILIVA